MPLRLSLKINHNCNLHKNDLQGIKNQLILLYSMLNEIL